MGFRNTSPDLVDFNYLHSMKRAAPIYFVILALTLFACSKDENPGNFIRKIKVSTTDSDGYVEKKFEYDDQGRIARINWSETGKPYQISEFIYSDNLLTINEGSSIHHFLKFENENLVQYVLSQTFEDNAVRNDTVNFSYMSGSLKTISYNSKTYTVEADVDENIIALSDVIRTPYGYDKRTNPFYRIPNDFLTQSRESARSRELILHNIIRYFSKNNVESYPVERYEYTYGKVSKIVSSPDFYMPMIQSYRIVERITYRDL